MGCRAACVLAVLLAGLVPLGQGQEREKVRGGGPWGGAWGSAEEGGGGMQSVVPPLCWPGWAVFPALGARRAAGYGPWAAELPLTVPCQLPK